MKIADVFLKIQILRQVLEDLHGDIQHSFEPAVQAMIDAVARGGKIMICGNGGSAAMAQHMAAEFVVRFDIDRPAVAAMALTCDTSILTACGNDYGYERIFSRQVEAYGHAGDVLVGYSTSGKSRNVANAFATAQGMGIIVIGLSGNGGMQFPTDVDVVVRTHNTARIQEAQLLLTHLLVEAVLTGVKK